MLQCLGRLNCIYSVSPLLSRMLWRSKDRAVQVINRSKQLTSFTACREVSKSYQPILKFNHMIPSLISSSHSLMPKRYLTVNQRRMRGKYKRKKRKGVMFGNPHLRGIILKLVVRKPRKPNSAQRKCALVKLSNGKRVFAYIPGVGHNLQEHNIVLVQGGGPQDTPAVNRHIVRGKYDCAHVKKK